METQTGGTTMASSAGVGSMTQYTILIDGEHFNTFIANLEGAKFLAKKACHLGSCAEIYDAENKCVWQVFN
jgi:hypothetical protein